ncbi:carbonic anhydrase [Spirillospora sp. NPDC049652]
MNEFSRRSLLRSGLATGGLGVAALVPALGACGGTSQSAVPVAQTGTATQTTAPPTSPTGTPTAEKLTPAQAWSRLAQGNRTWAAGKRTCPQESAQRRQEVAAAQNPFAVVVSCMDSRLPPETVFDQGVGALFVVRTGAQTIDDLVKGSIEYGPVEHDTPLIVVMGHQRCGAVKATVESLEHDHPLPKHLNAIVESIKPAYEQAHAKGGDVLDQTIRAQTLRTVATLAADPALSSKVGKGTLGLVAAYYSLDSGQVSVLQTIGFKPS